MGLKIDQLNAITSGDVNQADDLVPIFDESGNKLKKISVADFLGLGTGFDINALPDLTLASIAGTDKIPVYDASAGTPKKISFDDLIGYTLANLDDATSIAAGSIVQASDYVFVYDVSTNLTKKLSVEDFLALAGAGTLTYFTESEGVVSGSEYSGITPNGVASNIDVAIIPKGDGALRISNDGNARGSYAIDLQKTRTDASNVAGGSYSMITNGYDNRADGAVSRAGGVEAFASLAGEDAWASGSLSGNAGGSQRSSAIGVRTSTGTSAFILYTSEYGTSRITLAGGADGAYAAKIRTLVMVRTVGNGTVTLNDAYVVEHHTLFNKTSNIVALIDANKITESEMSSASMSDTAVAITADTGNTALQIEITPGANVGTTTVLWAIAHIEFLQLSPT